MLFKTNAKVFYRQLGKESTKMTQEETSTTENIKTFWETSEKIVGSITHTLAGLQLLDKICKHR